MTALLKTFNLSMPNALCQFQLILEYVRPTVNSRWRTISDHL